MKTRTQQAGMSIILAIFLVTVLAALATSVLDMWRHAENDSTLDMLAIRAREAARAGLEWGFYSAVQNGCPAVTTNVTNLPGSLAQFNATVTCNSEGPYTDGPSSFRRYTISVTACSIPNGFSPACPNNTSATSDNYAESVMTGECLVDINAVVLPRCRIN